MHEPRHPAAVLWSLMAERGLTTAAVQEQDGSTADPFCPFCFLSQAFAAGPSAHECPQEEKQLERVVFMD